VTSIRDLLARVKIFRSDVIDNKLIYCIEEATKKLCRKTDLAKVILDTQIILAGVTNTTPTYLRGNILSITSIKAARVPIIGSSTPSYIGTFVPLTGVVSPVNGAHLIEDDSAVNFTTCGFYVASASGAVTIDDIDETIDIGDVIYSDGSSWQLIKKIEFEELTMRNDLNVTQKSDTGFLDAYVSKNAVSKWIPIPKYDTAVFMECSYCPTEGFVYMAVATLGEGDAPEVSLTEVSTDGITTIPLPPRCEDVIIDGALSMAYLLPGEGQDKKLGLIYADMFLRGISNLRAWDQLGQYGLPQLRNIEF